MLQLDLLQKFLQAIDSGKNSVNLESEGPAGGFAIVLLEQVKTVGDVLPLGDWFRDDLNWI